MSTVLKNEPSDVRSSNRPQEPKESSGAPMTTNRNKATMTRCKNDLRDNNHTKKEHFCKMTRERCEIITSRPNMHKGSQPKMIMKRCKITRNTKHDHMQRDHEAVERSQMTQIVLGGSEEQPRREIKSLLKKERHRLSRRGKTTTDTQSNTNHNKDTLLLIIILISHNFCY